MPKYSDLNSTKNDTMIDNYVEAYLPLIKECNSHEVELYLPNSNTPNYIEIIKKLKEEYCKYLDSLAREGKNTMDKFNKYMILENKVDGLNNFKSL